MLELRLVSNLSAAVALRWVCLSHPVSSALGEHFFVRWFGGPRPNAVGYVWSGATLLAVALSPLRIVTMPRGRTGSQKRNPSGA